MVRRIKRAKADDRWKVRGTRGEVNPSAERLERHPVDALPPNPDHDPVPSKDVFQAEGFHGYAPTGRALKRVRFAADRVEDDAETPEATAVSAPPSLPSQDATKLRCPISCQHLHPNLDCQRLQMTCLIK